MVYHSKDFFLFFRFFKNEFNHDKSKGQFLNKIKFNFKFLFATKGYFLKFLSEFKGLTLCV